MMNWNLNDAVGAPVKVTALDKTSLLADIAERFATEQGFSIATLNLDHVVKLRKDQDFGRAYSAHTHVTADGNPIVWLSRLSGQSNVALAPGSELIVPACEVAAKHSIPVALFGATQESLNAAAAALKELIPGLEIALCLAPPMGFDPDGPLADEAIEALRESGARLTFLAIGAPKQERFAARAQQVLPTAGFLSIGAGLDFISGEQVRAPVWVRKLSLEWVWRMFGNPRRLAMRYAACIAIMPRLTFMAWRERQ